MSTKLKVARGADLIGRYNFPDGMTLDGFDGKFVVYNDIGSYSRLSITSTPNANGSFVTIGTNWAQIQIGKADLDLLPANDDATQSADYAFDFFLVNGGVTSKIHGGPFTVLPVGAPNSSNFDQITVSLGTAEYEIAMDSGFSYSYLASPSMDLGAEVAARIAGDEYLQEQITAVSNELVTLPDVLVFGADPTGVADSTAAFQRAGDLTGVINVPKGTYKIDGLVSFLNKDISFICSGRGDTVFLMNTAASGIRFEDTQTSDNQCYRFTIEGGVTFLTNRNDRTGVYAKWRPGWAGFHEAGTFDDIQFLTYDTTQAQSWVNGIHVVNGQGITVNRVDGLNQNQYATFLGSLILFDGFCLITKLSKISASYFTAAVEYVPLPVALIGFTGQTTNFYPGLTITSSSGATGVLLAVTADSGAVGTISIYTLSGTWNVGDSLLDTEGGNGTVSSVDLTRTRATEGIYVDDVEAVGCSRGVWVHNGMNVAFSTAGVALSNIHANCTVASLDLTCCYQVDVVNANFYALGNNYTGILMTGCHQGKISARIADPTASYTNTTGISIVPGDNTYGTGNTGSIIYDIEVYTVTVAENIDTSATLICGRLNGTFTSTVSYRNAITGLGFGHTNRNANTGGGSIAYGLSVSSPLEAAADIIKAALIFTRTGTNGRGHVGIYNNYTNDTGNVTLSDHGLVLMEEGQIQFPALTADPVNLSDGQVWYNSSSNTLKLRAGGVTKTITAA